MFNELKFLKIILISEMTIFSLNIVSFNVNVLKLPYAFKYN